MSTARQIIVHVDTQLMSADDLQQLNAAVEILSALAKKNAVTLTSKRLHADRGRVRGSSLQPQTQAVLDHIRHHYPKGMFTVAALAAHIGLTELGTRAQLHTLLNRGYVVRHPRGRTTDWSLAGAAQPS